MRRHSPLLCGLLAACSSSDGTSPGSGSLTLTIAGPTGMTPSVVVTGPQSYSKTVTSTTTLTGLPAGTYTISAATAFGSDSVVATAYAATITGAPATVSAGHSASASVSYAARPGSGAIWVVGGYPAVNASIPNAAQAYSASQLRVSGAPTPVTTLTLATTADYNVDASAAIFDSAGNLWIANQNSNTITEFTPAQLGGSGSPTPAVTMTMPSDSEGPATLRFDAHHNLWIVNQWAGTIIELTPAQLVTGTPVPTVTIHDTPPEHATNQTGNAPFGIAFDAAGNLWVAQTDEGSIIEYTAAQLTTSGTPTPAIKLTPTLGNQNDSSVVVPTGLVFDSGGNLWVSGLGIYEIAAPSLSATGSPVPARWLTPPRGAHGFYDYVTALVFDDSGDLWFAGFDFGIIGEYTAAQIAAGGDPAPAVEITLSGRFAAQGLAFDR